MAAAAETRLTGLLVSRERFWGLRNRGAVTMLGAPPALAKTRFPVASSDVSGREPPEARAADRPQTGGKETLFGSGEAEDTEPQLSHDHWHSPC